MSSEPESTADTNSISIKVFFETVPPSQLRRIADLGIRRAGYQGTKELYINTPDIRLHCPSVECGGVRTFRSKRGPQVYGDTLDGFVDYVCSNCNQEEKRYSVAFAFDDNALSGKCYKYGELPAFGVPTPTRLLELFGDDRELFLKGRRCENQGLGVGAFTYYRRVVERRKDNIFDAIIRVSEKTGVAGEVVDSLKAAKREIQFSRAIDTISVAIPAALMVNGHNPITLLHAALSSGVHEQSDEKCLELAHHVRVVLADLAERLGQMLKDDAELNTAVTKLLQVRSQSTKKNKD